LATQDSTGRVSKGKALSRGQTLASTRVGTKLAVILNIYKRGFFFPWHDSAEQALRGA